MRKAVLFCFFLFIGIVSVAQTMTQQGVAYRYNGRQQRTPLGNVTITYDANRRTIVSDEQNGTFSMTLTGRRMGDRIGLVTVRKREMMVFNQHAVDEWSVRREPLVLILCNADEFERQKDSLIAIGRRQAKRRYDQQKAALEAQLNASEIERAKYEAALDSAYQELERLNKNIGDYADLFARIDESEIDTLAQQAVALFNQGEVDRAIALFEQGRYMERLDQALRTSQQADQLMAVAAQAKTQATQDSIRVLESLKAQIEAYKVNNEWEKAGELLKGLADRLNTVDACWDYAYFCFGQNNFTEAEIYYQRAIACLECQDDKENELYVRRKSSLLNNLAYLYSTIQRFSESEAIYQEAVRVCRQQSQMNSVAYAEIIAQTWGNLALLYYDTQRFSESEVLFQETLEIYKRLSQENPDAYNNSVAINLNNLGNLYADMKRFPDSETMFLEALDVRRRLAQANPKAYESDVALTLNNLALLYINTQRFTESEVIYLEALERYRRLVLVNPSAYEPDMAATLNNLAILYKEAQRFSESERLYKEALEIRRRLAQANPAAYEPDVARTLHNMASLYYSIQRYTESEAMYQEALEIYRRLPQANLSAYEQNLATTLFNLANLYSNTQRFTESEAMYQEALEIRRRLAQAYPAVYEPDLATTLGSMSFNTIFLKNYAKAEQLAREGLQIDSTQHWIASNLAAALLFQGKYAEAETIYHQYKDELKDGFLDDFIQFAEAGVIPEERKEDVERIKAMLNE